VGRHIPDFVSFMHRIAIELVNANETEAIAADRTARQAWLEERGYKVVNMTTTGVEADLAAQLDRLQASLPVDR
jgi:tRNA/rRNA methyltransferase